jgi:hypothetical protein
MFCTPFIDDAVVVWLLDRFIRSGVGRLQLRSAVRTAVRYVVLFVFVGIETRVA